MSREKINRAEPDRILSNLKIGALTPLWWSRSASIMNWMRKTLEAMHVYHANEKGKLMLMLGLFEEECI